MEQLLAQMAGTIITVLVKEGESFKQDQDLLLFESMKMEIPLAAPAAGRVEKIYVEPGQFINEGELLLTYRGD